MEDIIDLILNSYDIANPTNTSLFLQKLKEGEEYHKRLLICLGIDTKGGLIDKTEISRILNSIDYTKCIDCDSQLIEYENALKVLSYFLSKKSFLYNKKLARVMRATTFSSSFFHRIDGNLNDIKDWREVRIEIDRGNLDSINMPNDTALEDPRSIVWCTPLDELEQIINHNIEESTNPANDIIDRLGLYLTTMQDYIYIIYPDNFDKTLFQPSNLCNCWIWKDSLYLSYISNDNFGRTRPRSGDNENKQMKEAVHKSIMSSSDFKCSVKFLGTVTEYDLNSIDFTNDALKRYAL